MIHDALVNHEKSNMATDVQGEEVALLRAKNERAFRLLIERLQQPIIGYLHRLVGDREVALDLAQDTFLQVYKEIGKTSLDLALDAWIYRIATNYGLQYLNRRNLRKFISLFDATAQHKESEQHGMSEANVLRLTAHGPSLEEQTETRMLVKQALDTLKPKDAACLQLHYGCGMTYEQISEILKTTPEAVRKRVTRSVEKFREVYRKISMTAPITSTMQESER